ncbi:MAG: hypothetical protein ABI761_05265, partial [Saprospiraceae bacterium]
MNRLLYLLTFISIAFLACKPEHPDLKTAQALFLEAKNLKQEILTSKIDVLNQAKMVDSRIRNEDKESVFAISEAYNHLDEVDKGLTKLVNSERAVPGHEKEAGAIMHLDPKMAPSMVLMIQKNYKDSLQSIKIDLDA